MDLIKVKNLRTRYRTEVGEVKAVDGVSFKVNKKEIFGLVGESGCGKSTLCLSILKLLPPPTIISGEVYYQGKDLLQITSSELAKIRWKKISIIYQGSMNGFNPLKKCKEQIAEAILLHEDCNKVEALNRTSKLLQLVGIDLDSGNKYPHELSGGMKQRIMIAMSIACNPELVIADEPTTALDTIIQRQILDLMQDLRRDLDLSLIYVSHALHIITEICDRVAVMYAGKIVEQGDVTSINKNPYHPYTQGLMKSNPKMKRSKKDKVEWYSIPGSPPSLIKPPSGCRFHIRCPYVKDICRKYEPKIVEIENEHYVACHML